MIEKIIFNATLNTRFSVHEKMNDKSIPAKKIVIPLWKNITSIFMKHFKFFHTLLK